MIPGRVSWWRRRQVEDWALALSKAVWPLAAAAHRLRLLGDTARAAAVVKLIDAVRFERQRWMSVVDSPPWRRGRRSRWL